MSCDRCCASAVTTWLAPGPDPLEIEMCGHHTRENAPKLTADGWRLIRDERAHEIHPRLGPVTADPASH